MTTPQQIAKEAAARRAAALVEDGMTLGLGTGSTASLFLEALSRRVREEGLEIRGVPTSEATARLARELELPLVDLSPDTLPDLVVDGADEADRMGRLIKGGGGALVREKLVATAGLEMAVIIHREKLREGLGAFPLPVAVLPFGWQAAGAVLSGLGADVRLRVREGDEPFCTDDGLWILDCAFGRIDDPEELEAEIESIPGVMACGLFTDLATRMLVGGPGGEVEELRPERA